MTLIKFLITGLSVIALTGMIASCSCSSCGKDEESEVPYEVLVRANEFVVLKTGEGFFNKFIKPDFGKIKKLNLGYFMVYRLYIPEKPFVDVPIRFTVDSLGNVLRDREIVGIPDCNQNPINCDFIIDKTQAKQIASENKLTEGIKPWDVGFIWDANYNKHVWHVLSTLSESEGGEGRRANGKEVVIDPNTGEVLAINDWRVN